MALSVFDDRSRVPALPELKQTLAKTAKLWSEIEDRLAREHGADVTEWNFAGAKFGWSMRIKRKDRVILYLIPQAAHFLVGVVLGERAVKAALECGLPQHVIDEIQAARPYAEGRGFRLPVRSREDVDVILQLARVKITT